MYCWCNRNLNDLINEFFLAQIQLPQKRKKKRKQKMKNPTVTEGLNANNAFRIDIPAIPSIYLFFWCSVQSCAVLLGPSVDSFNLVVV